jgi:hypothetical protein
MVTFAQLAINVIYAIPVGIILYTIGLLLAMPITVSLVVIGKQLSSLAFLNTLFAQTSSESE